jgi:hypothetical protein
MTMGSNSPKASDKLKLTYRFGMSAAAVSLCVLAWQPCPAAASEMTDNLLGFFGVKPKTAPDLAKGEEVIDYRAHPPLVIPPKMDLPPPQTNSSLPTDWPTDPDAMARRKALLDSRRPVPGSHVETAKEGGSKGGEVATAPPEKDDSCIPVAGQSYCLISSPWDFITDKIGIGGKKDERVVLSGEEPPRKFLVDPPPGYQIPSAPPEKTEDSKTADTSADSAPRSHKHKPAAADQ